jgi:glycosyltransferase involved in cell wall biosynthesis
MPVSRRILLLVTDLEIGGTPTVVRELATRLAADASAHVHAACLGRFGPVARQIAEAHLPVSAFDGHSWRQFPSILRRLLNLIDREGIDTIFSFLVHANAVAAAAALARPQVRLLISIQGALPRPRWHWGLHRLIHHAAQTVVVPTKSAAAAAMRWSGIPRHKLAVVPNAVDPASFSGISPPAPDQRPCPIGFLGRLDPVKRLGDLIQATALLKGRVHLHVFGDGADRAAAEAQIAALGVGNLVTLHGAVDHPRRALERVAVLVLPSEAEGFGLVLIEAMAAGVPIVATDVPGIRDVVVHGESGLLVPVRSPPRLAAAIESLIEDRALRQRLTARGVAQVRERFSWEPVMAQYRRLLHIRG